MKKKVIRAWAVKFSNGVIDIKNIYFERESAVNETLSMDADIVEVEIRPIPKRRSK